MCKIEETLYRFFRCSVHSFNRFLSLSLSIPLYVCLQFGRLNNNDKYKISHSLGNISTTAMNKHQAILWVCLCVYFHLLLSFFPHSLHLRVFFLLGILHSSACFSIIAIVKSSYFPFFYFFFSFAYFFSLSFVLSNFFVGRIIHFISVYKRKKERK